MFETLAATLLAGLSLWNNKEKNKYVDRLMELKRLRFEEQNKPEDQRSDAILDNLDFELRILCLAFHTGAREQNLTDIKG